MTIKNILGSVSFELLGDYSASTTYQYLNVIKQNNHWYICQIRGGIINLPPAATFIDNTQWVRFVESGDNSLTSITFKTGGLNNLIDMGRRDLADFEFINGHIIKNFSDSGGVAHRDTLEYKGTDLTVTDTGVVTEVDFTVMDGKISNNTTEIAKLVGTDPDGNINNITNVSNATPNNADALVFNSTTSAYEPRSLGRVTQIATDTAYANRRNGTGWNAGDLMTPSTSFNIEKDEGTKSVITITFPDAPALFSLTIMTGLGLFSANGPNGFFNVLTDGAPAIGQFIAGSFQAGSPNLLEVSSEGGGTIGALFARPRDDLSGINTGAVWATRTKTLFDSITKDTTGTTIPNLRNGAIGPYIVQRQCEITVSGNVVTFTADNAFATTISGTTGGGTTGAQLTAGAAPGLQLFTLGRIYQRTVNAMDEGGWFEYIPSALNIIASGTNI